MFGKKKEDGSSTPQKQKTSVKKNSDAAPYMAARREWNERYGSYIAQAKNWRLTAIAAMVVAGISVGGIVHIGSQSKIQPYVVEVDGNGQMVNVLQPMGSNQIQRTVVYQIKKYITDVYGRNPGYMTQSDSMQQAKLWSTSDVINQIVGIWAKDKPQTGSDGQVRTIQFVSLTPMKDGQVSLTFRTQDRDLNTNAVTKTITYTGFVEYSVNPPTNINDVSKNPTGLQITGLHINKQF